MLDHKWDMTWTWPTHSYEWTFPAGLAAAVREVAGVLVGSTLFSWLHNLAGTDVRSATMNAYRLQSVERSLHLDIEIWANHWLVQHPVLIQPAVAYYRLYYLPLASHCSGCFSDTARCTQLAVRRTLIVMAPLALLVFWLLPMSPPRFALGGIVDIVAQHDLGSGAGSRDLTNRQNHFSAMPRLHVG